MHYECRKSEIYPRTKNIKRIFVPDDKVCWHVQWHEYHPSDFTSPHILGQNWADPDLSVADFKPQWNVIDTNIDRVSECGTYDIVDGRPRNPVGRTGLRGRGALGRWGPNKAADPIVTRWKVIDGKRVINENSKKPILQFVAIERRDCAEWAIPGGMVDPGEQISSTLKREFMEEALNIADEIEDKREILEAKIEEFFSSGVEVFRGYVDDPRNTDNAWIETMAVHFHDEENKSMGLLPLTAGDDARNVRWMDISRHMKLYANHSEFIKTVAANIGAHW